MEFIRIKLYVWRNEVEYKSPGLRSSQEALKSEKKLAKKWAKLDEHQVYKQWVRLNRKINDHVIG